MSTDRRASTASGDGQTARGRSRTHTSPGRQDGLRKERQLLTHGPVLAIGGHEDKTVNGEILQQFIHRAGGNQARVVLIPAASDEPEEMAAEYEKVFTKAGAASVETLDLPNREAANAQQSVETIEAATGVFVTGGDQARLVERIIGTRVMNALRVRNAEGAIVAGTSAGASLVATHMLLGGTDLTEDSGDSAARKMMVEVVAGLGLLPDVIIDQHFSQRGRMGRLLAAFAANPGLIGIGLDENTAILVHDGGRLETLGNGMVTLVNGRDTVSDYFERQPGEVLTILHSSLHVLGPGRQFDLIAHTPLDTFVGLDAAS